MTVSINYNNDLPSPDSDIFSQKALTVSITKFLENPSTSGPLTIALDGEWGSGKTSLIKNLENYFNKNPEKNIIPIYFEAWRYETTDPALGIIHNILNKLETEYSNISKSLIKEIGIFAVDCISQKFFNKSIDDLRELYDKITSQPAVETFDSKLKELFNEIPKNKKLFLMIDDLERCEPDNIFGILRLVKSFLSIENCIVLIPVDMEKLERQWLIKYGLDNNFLDDGRSFLDKIFQIHIFVAFPGTSHMQKFLDKKFGLIDYNEYDNFDVGLVKLIGTIAPNNPRYIKRLLNLIAFRSCFGYEQKNENIDDTQWKEYNTITAILWTLLQEILNINGTLEIYKKFHENDNFISNIRNSTSDEISSKTRLLLEKLKEENHWNENKLTLTEKNLEQWFSFIKNSDWQNKEKQVEKCLKVLHDSWETD